MGPGKLDIGADKPLHGNEPGITKDMHTTGGEEKALVGCLHITIIVEKQHLLLNVAEIAEFLEPKGDTAVHMGVYTRKIKIYGYKAKAADYILGKSYVVKIIRYLISHKKNENLFLLLFVSLSFVVCPDHILPYQAQMVGHGIVGVEDFSIQNGP